MERIGFPGIIKRVLCLFSCFLLLFVLNTPGVTVVQAADNSIEVPELVSETAVVIDAETGQVLYQKNKDQKMAPASITKIISAAVALENGIALDETITMSHDAVFSVPRYSSHIALDEGEELTMEDALYAMMLASANDAANGIAEKVAGSNDEFVAQMNALAQKVGAVNTHFTNPHGLIDSDHYTTAYDMALLTRYAMENEAFLPFFTTVTYETAPTNKQPESRIFSNQNEMIKNTTYKYEGAFGGKLGYTEEALYTIVTAAKRGDRTLICVCMRSDPYAQQYADAAAALDFAFETYQRVEMTADDLPVRSVTFSSGEDSQTVATGQILTDSGSVYYLPLGLGEEDYTVTFNYAESGNQLEGFSPKAIVTLTHPVEGVPSTIEVPLQASISELSASSEMAAVQPSSEITQGVSKVMGTLWGIVKWVLLAVLLLALLVLGLRIWFVYDTKKKRRQRLEREKRRNAMLKQKEHQLEQYRRREDIRRQMRRSGANTMGSALNSRADTAGQWKNRY